MFTTMKKSTFLLAFCLIMQSLVAQKQVLNDVLQAKTRGTGAILKDNVVTGYYSFYQLDKKDKKTRNYQLNILDQNLTPLSNKKFSSQEDLIALEASFNGELLMIKFFDDKSDKYILKTYDQNAEQVSSKTVESKKIYNPYAAYKTEDDTEDNTVTAIEGLGFVHFVTRVRGGSMSHTYNDIMFIPNGKDAKGWTWQTSEKSEDFEMGDYLGYSNNVILCLVTKRHKLLSSDLEDFILGLDATTGKKLFEKPLEDRKFSISTLNATTDTKGNFQLFGLYFPKEAKTAKASSLGIFGFTIDITGNVLAREYESWEQDVSKFLKVNEKGKIKDVGYLFFHKFVRTADNKIFGIAEQYKTNTGASIALSLLSGGATSFTVGDMYILEFDDKFDLKNVSVFDKTSTDYNVRGVAIGSGRAMGVFLNYLDAYDYSFTQVSKDKTKFSVGFVDYDKKKGDKGWYFGSINYSDGKLKTDKLKFDKKATWQHVYQGKPGYVMISEYFKKEKKLEFRMEKVNF
jgi:hypothetical protein